MAETCGVRPSDLYRGNPLDFAFDLSVLHTAAIEREKDREERKGQTGDAPGWGGLQERKARREGAVVAGG